MSAATLSRIETSKQSVDVDLLVTLAEVFGVTPAELIGNHSGSEDLASLTDRLAELQAEERIELLRNAVRRRRQDDLASAVDELLSTLDILREELERVGRAARKRRKT